MKGVSHCTLVNRRTSVMVRVCGCAWGCSVECELCVEYAVCGGRVCFAVWGCELCGV